MERGPIVLDVHSALVQEEASDEWCAQMSGMCWLWRGREARGTGQCLSVVNGWVDMHMTTGVLGLEQLFL
jgi:hypothetical protein